jgi:hypothetical protein
MSLLKQPDLIPWSHRTSILRSHGPLPMVQKVQKVHEESIESNEKEWTTHGELKWILMDYPRATNYSKNCKMLLIDISCTSSPFFKNEENCHGM